MTKKQRLLDCFKTAIEHEMDYMGLVTKTNSELQVAIIKFENYPEKIDQIIKKYNDNLKLKRNKNIQIIDFCCGDSIQDLLYDIVTLQEEEICI